jgi:hypothetical protein
MAHIGCMTCSRRTLICVLRWRYGMAVIQPEPVDHTHRRHRVAVGLALGSDIPTVPAHWVVPNPLRKRIDSVMAQNRPPWRLEIQPIRINMTGESGGNHDS